MKKLIYKDCLFAMWKAIGLKTVLEGGGVIIGAQTAIALGIFVEGVVLKNQSFLSQNLWILIGFLAIGVIFKPLCELFLYTEIYKGAFAHHSAAIERFLSKEYISALFATSASNAYRWEEDILKFRDSLLNACAGVLIFVVSCFGLWGALKSSWPLALVCILANGIPAIFSIITVGKQSFFFKKQREFEEIKGGWVLSLFSGHLLFKAMSAGEKYIKHMGEVFESNFSFLKKGIILKEATTFLSDVGGYLPAVAIIAFGMYFAQRGLCSISHIAAFIALSAPVKNTLANLSAAVGAVGKIGVLEKRLESFYSHIESGELPEFNEKIHEISAQNLCFSYENHEILRGFSMKMPLNDSKIIELKGENGSGKSTLAMLIAGIISSDSMYLNGKNEREFKAQSIRKKVCYVPQKAYFFQGTIWENIENSAACSRGELGEMMEHFSIDKPIDYELSKGGENLSGGERQKLSIIRGILTNSDVIILDEPTNNLDKESIDLLTKLIIGCKDKAFVIISHDNSLIIPKHLEISVGSEKE